MTTPDEAVNLEAAVERGRRLSIRTVFAVKRGDVLRARTTFSNADVLTKGDIVIVDSVGDDGNIVFTNLFRPTIQCGLNPDRFDWMSRPVTPLVPDYALSASNARAVAAEEALLVIARASERSETMFGGKLSDVTRVFQNISRVARTTLASMKEKG